MSVYLFIYIYIYIYIYIISHSCMDVCIDIYVGEVAVALPLAQHGLLRAEAAGAQIIYV